MMESGNGRYVVEYVRNIFERKKVEKFEQPGSVGVFHTSYFMPCTRCAAGWNRAEIKCKNETFPFNSIKWNQIQNVEQIMLFMFEYVFLMPCNCIFVSDAPIQTQAPWNIVSNLWCAYMAVQNVSALAKCQILSIREIKRVYAHPKHMAHQNVNCSDEPKRRIHLRWIHLLNAKLGTRSPFFMTNHKLQRALRSLCNEKGEKCKN